MSIIRRDTFKRAETKQGSNTTNGKETKMMAALTATLSSLNIENLGTFSKQTIIDEAKGIKILTGGVIGVNYYIGAHPTKDQVRAALKDGSYSKKKTNVYCANEDFYVDGDTEKDFYKNGYQEIYGNLVDDICTYVNNTSSELEVVKTHIDELKTSLGTMQGQLSTIKNSEGLDLNELYEEYIRKVGEISTALSTAREKLKSFIK